MDRQTLFRYGLLVVALIIAYLSYIVVKPYLITVIMAFILTFLFYPVYRRLHKIIKWDWLASGLMILFILLLIMIPFGFFTTKIVTESATAYRSFVDIDFHLGGMPIFEGLPPSVLEQVEGSIDQVVGNIKDYIVTAAPDVLGSVATVGLHLFILFFIMFFAFKHGNEWYHWTRSAIPLNPKLKEVLFMDIERSTHAVVYGQFLTAVIQGTLAGVMFFIFGIPNPIFWGFIMIIFAFVPFLGTPLIFVPAAIIELVQKDYIAGIGVLLVGFIIITNIDNFLRPYLVGSFAKIHPILVVVGVFGGLAAFGFSGMILGPLILALLVTLIRDFSGKYADEDLEHFVHPEPPKKRVEKKAKRQKRPRRLFKHTRQRAKA